jgi:hypothetical protein
MDDDKPRKQEYAIGRAGERAGRTVRLGGARPKGAPRARGHFLAAVSP